MPSKKILLPQPRWSDLYFYRKSEVLYQMTVVFCRRFLPLYGDRTVDQMTQAARSGKQNIVEGCADGVTSTEMQLKLLNVARSSVKELQEDYGDYIKAHFGASWGEAHPRYGTMLSFCREHNALSDYAQYFERWTDEEMANTGYTLCRMVDKMMTTYCKKLEQDFVEQGGIRERMYAARTGYRQEQDARLRTLETAYPQLQAENEQLKKEIEQLTKEIEQLKKENEQLKAENPRKIRPI